MPRSTSTRRLALAAGLVAGLAVAVLPTAQADLVDRAAAGADAGFAPRLVTVTADLAGRNALAASGLDLTEHAGHDYVEVVLHTAADQAVLEALGLPFQVRIADLVARQQTVRAQDEAYASSVVTSGLPSGRTSYRTLADYETDLRSLAEANPDIVRLFELPHQTVEGKTVLGIEIAGDVHGDDGRPVMAIMGLHHAREWPSGENTMEFAVDLATGYGSDPRITDLLDRGRVLVVPVVNADGFEKSIRDGMIVDLRTINDVDPLDGTTSILATPANAYKRKNCRLLDQAPQSPPGACDAATSPGGFGIGVDLNRNYGTFHGGPGASDVPADPTYHGTAGFSEPETQNIRELVSVRHVTMLITNHTFGNLLLRPNGVSPETIGPDGLPVGYAPDEEVMAEVGARMTAQNGYSNQHGWELYDTTGTTEDWSYNATGGYGYTFEIGPNEFHPPFAEVVDEYLGAGEYAGKGNREAYLIALETAVDPAHHSLVVGQATPGATLELRRTGSTPTWEGSFQDDVTTRLTVPADGDVRWHVNPSTRPLVQSKSFHVLDDEPAQSQTTTVAVPMVGESVDVEWVVTESSAVGTVDLDWETPDDLDLELYRVQDDGSLTFVSGSGAFVGEKESTRFVDVEPGTYVARVINYASVAPTATVSFARFDAGTVETTPLIEAWTLSCFVDGDLVEQAAVIVDRSRTAMFDFDVCGPADDGKPGRGKGRGKPPWARG